MRKHMAVLVSILSLFLALSPAVYASEALQQTPTPGRDAPEWKPQGPTDTIPAPVIQKVRDGVFQVGNVTVDKNQGQVTTTGEINMAEGLLEYLACGPMGKLHESLLKLDVQPFHLQVALLLLGLEPGSKPLDHQGASGVPEGDPVQLWVSWTDVSGKRVEHRAEDLVFDEKQKQPMTLDHWIFTGSQVMDGRFMAQVEQSIVATYHDPFAMFDHPLGTGMDDTVYFVNKKVVPPVGTPVMFMVKPLRE